MKRLPHVVAVLAAILFMAANETEKKPEIKPGDTVIVAEDGTKLMRGTEVVAELKKRTEIKVTQVKDDWIGGHLTANGEQPTGWIRRGHVHLVFPIGVETSKERPNWTFKIIDMRDMGPELKFSTSTV